MHGVTALYAAYLRFTLIAISRMRGLLSVWPIGGLLMTKETFLQLRKSLARETPPLDRIAAISLFGLAVLGIPIGLLLQKPIAFAYIALLLLASICYLIYSLRWARKTGLLCHSCQRPMLRQAGDIALATGNCPHCGRSAFSAPAQQCVQAETASFHQT